VQSASTPEAAARLLPDVDVILCWKFPTHLLSSPAAANVRWVQSMGAGVDDLVADKTIPSGISITRIVDQFGAYIAEYVFTYLLYLTKDVQRMRASQLERKWDAFLTGTLGGKKMGVAGLGSIGVEIVRKAAAFDMTVHGLSISGANADIVDRHYAATQWPAFVSDLDVLVLTLPLTPATEHVINRDVLMKMKPGAWLVNVGRGKVVTEQDLVDVLQSGHLGGAVLDVFEQEPLPQDSPLWSLPNAILTPHISGPSTLEGVGRFFLDNLARYISGTPLCGLVNRAVGY